MASTRGADSRHSLREVFTRYCVHLTSSQVDMRQIRSWMLQRASSNDRQKIPQLENFVLTKVCTIN